jgi:hypothetical protein
MKEKLEHGTGEHSGGSLCSAFWTKELPTQDGYYWYREDGEAPIVIEWEQSMQWVMRTGTDIMIGHDMTSKIDGEFWSERLSPPNVRDHRRLPVAGSVPAERSVASTEHDTGSRSVDRIVRVLSPSGYGLTIRERPLKEGEIVEIKDAHIEIQSASGYQISVKTETHEEERV